MAAQSVQRIARHRIHTQTEVNFVKSSTLKVASTSLTFQGGRFHEFGWQAPRGVNPTFFPSRLRRLDGYADACTAHLSGKRTCNTGRSVAWVVYV